MSVTMLGDFSIHTVGGAIGDKITPETIAHHLAHINRYNGAFGAYSVAQHCVHVSEQLPPLLKFSGLMHDVCEVWTGDITSPIKKALYPLADKLEAHYLTQVDARWEVETRHELVHEADLRMLITEIISFGAPVKDFPTVEPYDFTVRRWTAEQAKAAWLALYYALV
jgi:5'-deoxynucleotidase YfbR-like HD superfamily hydrolase